LPRSTRRFAQVLCLLAALFQTACQSVGALTEPPPEIDVARVESGAELEPDVDWRKIGETITYVVLYVAVTSLDVYYARTPGNWQNTPQRR
jgi:predicted component of type VI protein secretion system